MGQFENKAFNFEQTHSGKSCRFLHRSSVVQERVMAILNKDKHKEYARFAAHCLDMVASTRDQKIRRIQREMAAEWMKLADAVKKGATAHPGEHAVARAHLGPPRRAVDSD